MIERRLRRQLDKAARRFRHQRLVWVWAAVWALAATLGGLLFVLNGSLGWYWPWSLSLLVTAAAAAALACTWWALSSVRDTHWVARRIEATYPDLQACLLAAIDQHPILADGRYGYLQERVIQQSLEHAYGHAWERALPGWWLLPAHGAHLLAFAGFVAMLVGLSTQPRPPAAAAAPEILAPLAVAGGEYSVQIEPGDTEVERGSSLLVLARFAGPLPPDVVLDYTSHEGTDSRVVMSKSLDDPVFGGRIPAIHEPLTYRVAFAGQQTQAFHVTVFVYPELTRADATLVFPAYTSLADRLIEDVRQLSVVEGTQLKLRCDLNKPVQIAQLVDKEGNTIDLSPAEGDPARYSGEIKLDASQRFELKLVDEQGRSNQRPPEFVFTVVPNKPPELKLVKPSRDLEVSPLEELQLQANAWDDFGVSRFGLYFTRPDGSSQELVLGESATGKRPVELQHLLAFEELHAEPDQLVSYHFWAEDTGPDGTPRRSASDMYFAEVRPFEEIFRQGRQPAGGESQESQQAGGESPSQQLAELQKEIINGTWKLMRREATGTPSQKFADDMSLLLESQTTALAEAEKMAGELDDPQAMRHADQAQRSMSEAVRHLTEARDQAAVAPLEKALAHERAAYQWLLKLRAREHQVVQSRSNSRSASRGSPRAQQQLQQLELKNDQNRYETERLARSQEQDQNRETRQVLNRLRDLARRQHDLNARVKELQSSLQEAQTEEQREELKRQLKRLREQQEQLLRDTDELLSRMQQPENQSQMAQPRQELEQARENVRQAAESLKQGQASQAVASGTRAERELEHIRDDVRRQSSSQFADEMRELRDSATQLDERGQDLAQRLAELQKPTAPSRSLRDADQREAIQEGLGQQQQQLDQLLQRMQQTVVEAEEAEPLLADQLYDSYREAQRQQPGRALDSAQRSLRQGLLDDATQQERTGREGIHQLREGVDRAAESVLGDETEALRRARDTVRELAQQAQDEMQRAAPESNPETSPKQTAPGERDAGDPKAEPSSPSQERSAPTDPGQSLAGGASSAPRPESPRDTSSRSSPGERQADGSGQESPPGGSQQPATPLRDGPRGGQRTASADGLGGFQQLLDETASTAGRPYAPISGGDFRDWSDRLRDVEEMVGDPELRAQAARIRERARAIRSDMQRHSQPPNWDLVRLQIVAPLAELRDRLAEELLKHSAKDALVPIDRDPVPPKYEEPVRRYYEQLGSGR